MPQLQQELLDVLDQLVFKFPFVAAVGQRQEIKHIRVLEGLLRKIRVRRRHGRREVGDCLA
ncbi:hypothetical protein [Arthrobacter globiformis]|uniref:hypothetical protein n=1 Tax=Arthrobacter globiformis TaxID=1665 RepID=UPI00277E7DEC|nr:hypothetical protein [Arthrobacter globiformis]